MSVYRIKPEISALVDGHCEKLAERFKKIDDIIEYNTSKVISAFANARVGVEHLTGSTGYGHGDLGRDKLEELFADIFATDDAIVRPHIVSGTHAITLALFGVLRPGDEFIAAAGKPYDTFDDVIGLKSKSKYNQGSLIDWGISYKDIDKLPDGRVDVEKLVGSITDKTKLILFQRSKGYDWRPSITITELEDMIKKVKAKKPDVICFVDNCYCEFADTIEPPEIGADIIAGSLIKNPGGGIAPTGGYIAGRADLIEQISYRLTAPGIGRDGGATLDVNRLFYQGLFNAPSMVGSALKGMILTASVFRELGYDVEPPVNADRADIIQAIKLGSQEKMERFCKSLQEISPVESYLKPVAEVVPGYHDRVIMAAGTFVEGSTIELSADGPMREPYAVYMQGGLSFAQIKLAIKHIASQL